MTAPARKQPGSRARGGEATPPVVDQQAAARAALRSALNTITRVQLREVAERAGVSLATLEALTKESRPRPLRVTPERLAAIARALRERGTAMHEAAEDLERTAARLAEEG